MRLSNDDVTVKELGDVTCSIIHFTLIMSNIATVADTEGYTAVDFGKMKDLMQHNMGCPGKVFLQDLVKSTSCQISVNMMPAGAAVPFFHSHKKHEEVYIAIEGAGEIQLGDKVLPFHEGSAIRVAPPVSRCIKNTGAGPLVFLCVQAEAGVLSPVAGDYKVDEVAAKFSK